MLAANQNPETQAPLPLPAVEEFRGYANAVRGDFTFQYMGGVRVPGGEITYDSLGAAFDRVSTAAAEDPSALALVEAVNTSHKVETSQAGDQTPRDVRQTPEFALAQLYGAVVPRDEAILGAPAAEANRTTPRRAARLGGVVLADGQAVHGLIVPGRREIVTAQGVVRTRGVPRTSL